MTLAPGQSLGRYRLEGIVGRGGMAAVYRARDTSLEREVAVKVILPEFATEPQFLERFRREARMVAALEHPNILPVYDVGEHDEHHFVVMPLVRGGTLADRLASLRAAGKSLPLPQILTWGAQLAAALDAAHAAGILHRDVKPGNVLLGPEDHLFLADFGIARLTHATTRLTHTGAVVGTPLYMSPEVASGRSAESASDLYSLAVIVYEMMAGKPPFEGDNVLSILHQHATRPAPPLTRWVDDLPPSLDEAMARGLAKTPGERPATCGAFVEALHSGTFAAVRASVAPTGGGVADTAVETLPLPGSAGGPAADPGTLEILPAAAAPAGTGELPGSGSYAQVRQWGTAGLVGGLVAIAGFVALQLWGPGAAAPPAGAEQEVAARAPAAGSGEGREGTAEPGGTPPLPAEPGTPQEDASAPVSPAPTPQEASADTAGTEGRPEPGAGGPDEPKIGGSNPPPVPEPVGPPGDGPSPARPGEAFFNALRAFGPRFDEVRRFRARSSEADFERVVERLRQAAERRPVPGPAEALGLYAEGGLAYLRGDRAKASEALRQLVGEERFLRFWGPSPLTLLASEAERGAVFEDWALALGYVDPGNQLAAALDRQDRASAGDPRRRLVRALVHRLDGEPRQVIGNAEPAWRLLGEEAAAEARAYVAQVIAEAYRDLGQPEEALRWFRSAVDAGGLHLGAVAAEAAGVARELRRDDEARRLLVRACQAENPMACRELRRPGDRARPPRRQPPGG